MRGFIIGLARRLPARHLSDRVLPWVTLCLAVMGAGWTFFQYSSGVSVQRANLALGFRQQFLQTFPNGADDFLVGGTDTALLVIYEIRCRQYALAIENNLMPETPDLPVCDEVVVTDRSILDRIGADAPKSVRDEIRNELTQRKLANTAQARRMLTFLRSLQICVDSDQCSRLIAGELFAGDIVSLLNATCPLASQDPEYGRQGRLLMQFVRDSLEDGVIPWKFDPNREDLGLCEVWNE